MNQQRSINQSLSNNRDVLEEVLAEQVRQIYALSIYGSIATIVNSLIVFFILKTVMPKWILIAWLTVILTVTAYRIALVVVYRRFQPWPDSARIWKIRFLVELSVIGFVWGSLAFFPFSGLSVTHEVFIAFVLGGMAAGAAATFSVLKEGYLAYSIPAAAPLAVRFFLQGDVIHYAMAGMLSFYGLLLWRISERHYRVNRTSLLLRFENRRMIESLKRAREKLLEEINAKLKAEAELRAHQDLLEKTVEERTNDLLGANEQLKAEIEERKQSEDRLALAQKAGGVGVFDVDLITPQGCLDRADGRTVRTSPGRFRRRVRELGKAGASRRSPGSLKTQFRKWLREGRKQVALEYRCLRGRRADPLDGCYSPVQLPG